MEGVERDDYVSFIRSRLLAEAFYLSGDIERYGKGFVRIREFLKDYPEIVLGVDEVGDFFKVEMRLTAHVVAPVTPPVGRVLLACEKIIGREKLQKMLGIKNKKTFSRIVPEATISPKLMVKILDSG